MSDLQGRALIENNRRITARRTGWPTGALAICEQLDTEHLGWTVNWMPESRIRGWECPAGFAAHRSDWSAPGADELRRLPEDYIARHPYVFGPSVPELKARIEAAEQRQEHRQAERDRYWASV